MMRGLSKIKLLLSKSPQFHRVTTVRWHGGPSVAADAPSVSMSFLQPDGETRTVVKALVGESLLQTAHRNEIDLEGACEGGTS